MLLSKATYSGYTFIVSIYMKQLSSVEFSLNTVNK